MPQLTIDGKEISVDAGTTVIQAAEKLGVDVPRYCYHPGLSVAGNCRICLVDIEKFPKLAISCHTQCADGMVVNTKSEKVLAARSHVMEFLLVNHPVDCPVCDQAGECRLQNYYMSHGLYDSRLDEDKVKKQKAVDIGPTVMLDSERCILCSRCVRFTEEITGTREFGIFNRGDHAEIGLYPGVELENAYSGNVVDICPVGALTDKDFRFKCRVWYLKSTPSVCPGCSKGCNIELHHQEEREHIANGDRLMRLKPRYHQDVNEWWICDEGRYGYKFADHDRIAMPGINQDGEFKESSWDDALLQVSARLNDKTLFMISSQMTNEDLYAVQLLCENKYPNAQLFYPGKPDGEADDLLREKDKNPNRMGALALGLREAGAQGFSKINAALESGEINNLLIFGQDLYEFLDENEVQALLNNLKGNLVFIGSNWNRTAQLAAVVLPSAVFAEKDGSFTNSQGRVQRISQAFAPKDGSRPEWQIMQELMTKMGKPWKVEDAFDVFAEMAAKKPFFNGLSLLSLGMEGVVRHV